MLRAITILIISVFFLNFSYAQKTILKLTNIKNNKEIILKEYKRVRVKTIDGKKISGKFSIVDDNTIMIKNVKIEIDQIEKIKKNPLFLSILTSGFFYYYATVVVLGGIVWYALSGEPLTALLTIPAGALIYGGIKPPNFLRGYNKLRWNYEIQKISE